MLSSTSMQERATHLMIGIIGFLNSALLYLSRDFSGKIRVLFVYSFLIANVLTSVTRGQRVCADEERILKDAIRRYNEGINDFTASCVNGIHSLLRWAYE